MPTQFLWKNAPRRATRFDLEIRGSGRGRQYQFVGAVRQLAADCSAAASEAITVRVPSSSVNAAMVLGGYSSIMAILPAADVADCPSPPGSTTKLPVNVWPPLKYASASAASQTLTNQSH